MFLQLLKVLLSVLKEKNEQLKENEYIIHQGSVDSCSTIGITISENSNNPIRSVQSLAARTNPYRRINLQAGSPYKRNNSTKGKTYKGDNPLLDKLRLTYLP